MSVLTNGASCPIDREAGDSGSLGCLTLRWRLDPIASRKLGAGNGRPPCYEIELRLQNGDLRRTRERWVGVAGLNGSERHGEGGAVGSVVEDLSRGFVHIDIPRLLAATFERREDGGARIVYARAFSLEQSGLAGGRYELAGLGV